MLGQVMLSTTPGALVLGVRVLASAVSLDTVPTGTDRAERDGR